MLFNSFDFIFLFFPLVLCAYFLLKSKSSILSWLTLAGYVFYTLIDIHYVFLLAFITLFNFWAGNYIASRPEGKEGERKLGLGLSVLVNIGILAVFKYLLPFLGASNTNPVLHLFGLTLNLPFLNILLPVGISVYTFQALSYVIDVYRKTIPPSKSWLVFAAYLSFFPTLTSGPIVRFSEISNDLENIANLDRKKLFHKGLCLFVIGLASKVILADTLALYVNPLWGGYSNLDILSAWLSVLGYTFQLYFDFSGYSDMAIGLGFMLGFTLPKNFNSPLKSLNISDFWRRWHMSLTRWVNDYVFLSLYRPKISRYHLYLNTVITMVILGIWHGPGVNFLLFGLYHGLMIVLYQSQKERYDKLPALLRRLITFLVVAYGFLIFRSDSLNSLLAMQAKLVDFSSLSAIRLSQDVLILSALITLSVFITQRLKNSNEVEFGKSKAWAVALGVLLIICLLLIGNGVVQFIYYKF